MRLTLKPGTIFLYYDKLFKTGLIAVFFMIMGFNAVAKIQGGNINLKVTNASLENIFSEIERQTNYTFVFTTEMLQKANTVNIELENAPLDTALNQLFLNQPLGYTIYEKFIIIKDKSKPASIMTKNGEAYSISGRVNDEKGQPVPGATVFITDTKNATATDGNGNFILNGLTSGNYELVVSMLGFEPVIQSVKIQDEAVNITIILKESNTVLNAVTIKGTSRPKQNARDLKRFIENFIGSSANARQCKILNPQALYFNRPKKQNVLEATSDTSLIIENDALGYRINYLLKKFVYYFSYDECYYDGSAYFEELKGTEQQQKQWEINRRNAYLGSARHFFRSAMNGTSRAEGFFIYTVAEDKNATSPLKPFDIDVLLKPVDKNFKALISKPYGAPRPDLYILHTRRE